MPAKANHGHWRLHVLVGGVGRNLDPVLRVWKMRNGGTYVRRVANEQRDGYTLEMFAAAARLAGISYGTSALVIPEEEQIH